MVKSGQIYKHYKGYLYQVVGVAKHSETLEELVVYFRQGEPSDIWVRPKNMFEEKLDNGNPRFELIKDIE